MGFGTAIRLVHAQPKIVVCCALFAASLMPAKVLRAQAVQLPTFSYFAIETSMMVPDQGTASMGGVSRSSSGSNQFGPPIFPGNRSYGSQSGAGMLRVTAQIHDLEAMDRALLGDRSGDGQIAGSGLAGGNGLAPAGSVAELASRKAASQAAEQTAAAQLYQRARTAQIEGKPGVAKVYLQMAAKRATGELKQQVLAALADMNGLRR